MGCSTGGCGSGGSSGSCNRKNSFDWFADMPLAPGKLFNIVEVSFKNGARTGFFRNEKNIDLYKGDFIVVDAAQGYDIGELSLSGELVKMQMRKKSVKDNEEVLKVIRKATEEEVENLLELRNREKEIMQKARVISRGLKLEMKIGDVEYQGDGRKVTFYYTSDARVDFRELVKKFVSTFKMKIEMRQIGARQEAQRLGGVGSCGRELCCSSFLTDFKSVSTGAARYQQLSITSDKLSGQCGRLKCCLNYELDTYTEAFKNIPKKIEKLKTKEGLAFLRKTDIFKMELTYHLDKVNKYYKISVDDVKTIQKMNREGNIPESLENFNIVDEPKEKEKNYDLVGQVNLKTLTKQHGKRRNNSNRNRNKKRQNQNSDNQNPQANTKSRNNQNRNRSRKRKPNPNQKPKPNNDNTAK